MKKVIDGKLYNTETALKIEEYWNGYGYSDFNFCIEALYKTQKGKYFLHGEGGAASKYAEQSGRNLDAGSEIIELSRMEAMEWLTDYNFYETIEKEFPDLIEEA
jgi:hypothetical protein